MTNKDLFDAIGKIDDDLVLSSAKNLKQTKKFRVIKRISAIAAALVIIITGITFGIPRLTESGDITVENDFGIVVKAAGSLETESKNLKSGVKTAFPTATIQNYRKNFSDEGVFSVMSSFEYLCNATENDSIDSDKEGKSNLSKSESFFKLFYKTNSIKFKDNYENFSKTDSLPISYYFAKFKFNSIFQFYSEHKKIKSVNCKKQNSVVYLEILTDKEKNEYKAMGIDLDGDIVLVWCPIMDISQYNEKTQTYTENQNNDYETLEGDKLSFIISYTDNTTEEFSIDLSWEKDGSLVAEMK